ncbi:MAG: ECF-type sigma factor [Gemmataceae bacterium]
MSQDQKARSSESLATELYLELRRVAQSMMSALKPGQTIQPTVLVHETYMRLTRAGDPRWDNRRHFFGAATQAMREILIEQARRKAAIKRGGGNVRVPLEEDLAIVEPPADTLLAVDEAIEALNKEEPRAAELVRLRYYAGLTLEEAAEVLGASVSTLQREWRFAKAWLAARLQNDVEISLEN